MKRYYAFLVTTFSVLLIICTVIYYFSYLESKKEIRGSDVQDGNKVETGSGVFDNNEGSYFLRSENGIVIVYYPDKKTVFEDTYINTNDLKPSEVSKLNEGFYVDDLDKLYSVLEGYTS